MADFNSVVLLGRMARDPELKYVQSGAPLCTFSIATNHHYTKSDGQKAKTVTFVDIDAWRHLAELCSQFLKKGREVLIAGELRQDRWIDAQTQKPRSKLKVVAHDVRFVGPKPENGSLEAPASEIEPEASVQEPAEA